MKLGIIISIAIVLVVAIIFGVMFLDPADSPTNATSVQTLATQRLPEDASPVFRSTTAGSANASYKQLLDYYLQNKQQLSADNVPDATATEVTNMLVEAMRRSGISQPFFDDMVSMDVHPNPTFGSALQVIPAIVLAHAEKLHEQGQQEQALEAAQSVWALGQRLFEHSVRFGNRFDGLQIMSQAGGTLYQMYPQGSAEQNNLQKWSTRIDSIIGAWVKKVEILRNINPKMGDLINIARNDSDITMRLEATLWLGIHQHKPGRRGNSRAIRNILAQYETDENPMLKQAAITARNITRDQAYKLR